MFILMFSNFIKMKATNEGLTLWKVALWCDHLTTQNVIYNSDNLITAARYGFQDPFQLHLQQDRGCFRIRIVKSCQYLIDVKDLVFTKTLKKTPFLMRKIIE